jgi:hypothetical protein
MKMTEEQKKVLEKMRERNRESVEKIKDSHYVTLVGTMAESALHLAVSWLKFMDDEEEFRKRVLNDETGRDILRAMAIAALSSAKEIKSYGGFDEKMVERTLKCTIAEYCLAISEEKESKEKSEQ